MAETYTTHFGIDFGPLPDGSPFPRINALLTVSKKWRELEACGLKPSCDPGDCTLEAAVTLFGDAFKVTPWAEIMLRDYTAHDEVIFIGPASGGKSHIIAAASVLFFACDPAHTACIMCSSTLADLKNRAWSPVKELVTALKNSRIYTVPIKILENEYCVCNDPNPDVPSTLTKRASIRGVALDEGRIQGQHVAHTLIAIDELSLITNLGALKTGIVNVSTGTNYKFIAAANPESWTSEVSSEFFMPPGGPSSVTPDTGSWVSKTGYFIRHLNGERSPAILQPEKAREWPFLLNEETRLKHLTRCGGDRDAPLYRKMVIGYPSLQVDGSQTVLDAVAAGREKATEPLGKPMWSERREYGRCAGVDPAYSPSGDEAIMAGCRLVAQDGRVYLDFERGVSRIPVVSSADNPVLKQLRDGVVARLVADGGPAVRNLAVDSSGNQMLGDELSIYVGPGCLAVNSSASASSFPLRAGDTQEARQRVADRGTEAWMVLAEFIKAGQVRGLPQSVVNDLCNRRYLSGANGEPRAKSKLEPKDAFCSRVGHGSPNEADACALAALAAKERCGVMPFGGVPPPETGSVVPDVPPGPPPPEVPEADFSGDYGPDDYGDGGYDSDE